MMAFKIIKSEPTTRQQQTAENGFKLMNQLSKLPRLLESSSLSSELLTLLLGPSGLKSTAIYVVRDLFEVLFTP